MLLFPISTCYSVNKPREYLSAEGFFFMPHSSPPTDKRGNVRELEGRVADGSINLKVKNDADFNILQPTVLENKETYQLEVSRARGRRI